MTTADLLQIDPETVKVSYHPQCQHGDRVSVGFSDWVTGHRYLLVMDPATAEDISRLMATALQNTGIQSQADQMKAAQRDR